MSQDTSINPYSAPAAELELEAKSGDIIFSAPKKLKGKEGFSLFSDAWKIYKQAPVKWIFVTLVLFIILFSLMIGLAFIPFVGSLLGMVIMMPLTAGLYIASEEVSRGEGLKFSHIFFGLKKNTGKLLGFGLAYTILYILSLAVPLLLFGFLDLLPMFLGTEADPEALAAGPAALAENPEQFFLVILSMMLMMMLTIMLYWFAVPLIAFQNQGVLQAMTNSFKGCLKNIWPLTLYGLAMIFWMFVAILPVGLGLLVLMPVMYITIYTGYRRIFTE